MEDDIAHELGAALGGTVTKLRRLSGGASRVTSALDLVTSTGTSPLILQEDRAHRGANGTVSLEADLLRVATAADVPAPAVVATGVWADGREWIVVERLDGETIPRKILRDDEWSVARQRMASQSATALAAIHRLDPTTLLRLPRRDPLRDTSAVLDALGVTRPVTELAARWLVVHSLTPRDPVVVHGDFRLGNLLVDHNGLRGVLDWELAHVGDPREDVGWLCARTWRFGGTGRVAGVGDLATFRSAYEDAGGTSFTDDDVTWWEVYAGAKWAAICAMQCSAHLSGTTRSVELATVGRRVCEPEWDILLALGVTTPGRPPADRADASDEAPFRHPTAAELAEALRESFDARMHAVDDPTARYQARVDRNALAIVERELRLGAAAAARHRERVRALGYADDASLVGAVRSGDLDSRLLDVAAALAPSVRDELEIAHPEYLTV